MAAAREGLQDAMALAVKTLDQLRLLSHALRPPTLAKAGLRAAAEGLCHEFAAHTSLTIRFDGPERLAVAEDVSISFYRFLQEALTNIGRHARADEVWVSLRQAGDALRMSVEDNGVGCDVGEALAGAGTGGIGLLGMQGRLDLPGGRLQIDSVPGEGTRLEAVVPLEVARA